MEMEREQHLSEKHTCHRQQYPSPDTSYVDDATPAPPSPPPSLPSSSASPRRQAASTEALPPSVVAAFQCIRESYEWRYTGPTWIKFPNVCTDDFNALVSAADSIGAYKQRYDYDPSNQLLVLRMPEGEPHAFTKNGMANAIWRRLTERIDLAKQQAQGTQEQEWESRALCDIKDSIQSVVEAPTSLPQGEETRPDTGFFYKGYACPPLVVEVGHSQKADDLIMLARKYIGKTDGDINTVITVKISYNTPDQRANGRRRQRSQQRAEELGQRHGPTTRSKSRQRQDVTKTTAAIQANPANFAASVSLFRLNEFVIHDQPFRDIHGDLVDGNLELNVADFVPLGATMIPRSNLERLTFVIPFGDIYKALVWGEQQQMLKEQTPPPQSVPRAGRKRVHFTNDWGLSKAVLAKLDAEEGAERPEGLASRSLRSSKKRRTDSNEGSPGPRSGSNLDSGLDNQGIGHAGPAAMPYRRRSSSRLRGGSCS